MPQNRKNKSFKAELDLLQKEIEECRIQYELHFNGIEPRPPFQFRERIQRKLRQLQMEVHSSTDRFRLNSLNHKFTSLKQYWDRVNLERESGVYHKDKMRLRRRMMANKRAATLEAKPSNKPAVYTLQDLLEAQEAAEQKSLNTQQDQQKEQKEKKAPTRSHSQKTPSSSPSSGLSEERIKAIYEKYIRTKKKRNEPVTNTTFDSLKRMLMREVAKLEAKGYRNVDFKVVIDKRGRTSLKALGEKTK